MLPGVECARRRRLGQNGGRLDSPRSGVGPTRRPSFCLYTSHSQSISSSSSTMKRSSTAYPGAYEDEKLGCLAREAKERLDERLRSQRKSLVYKGKNINEIPRDTEPPTRVSGKELLGSKKKTIESKNNTASTKLNWKAMEQDECAICLDEFVDGEVLASLVCAPRFHSKCLVPWLEGNTHCPCCRMRI